MSIDFHRHSFPAAIRVVLTLLTVFPCVYAQGAETAGGAEMSADYARTAAKAEHFFNSGEWLNATAMYTLMLDARPEVTETYAHAIVSDVMLEDTLAVTNLMEMSMRNNVSLDSLLSDIQQISTSMGVSHLYERILIMSKTHFPWLQRGMDSYLLKYYDFRDNGPEMVHYATIMLRGLPESVEFRRILARGYMLCGDYENAVATWRAILEQNPGQIETLLDLGNYYVNAGEPDNAIPYLEHAYSLRPTPYLTALLKNMLPRRK